MSGTGKTVNVLRRSPVQQNGTSAPRGKVSKTPQGRGSKSSMIVLAPMNGELARQEEAKSLGTRGRSSSFGKEEMNLMAARKVDPSVTNILSTVSQVKLYLYDPASGEWERTSTEGTLFIYSRSVEHSYGFMILNRLNNENMLEEVVPNMEFRVQNPFVLFKKKSGNIFGLCFQEDSSCHETGELLNSLSSQENYLPVNGHYSPKPRRNPTLNASMRSTSAPAFKNNAIVNGKQPYLIDVLETRSYTSSESENTSSPDSLTSGPISFIANPAAAPTTSSTGSAHHQGGGGRASNYSKAKSGVMAVDQPSASMSPKRPTKSGKNSGHTSSPRSIPPSSSSKGSQSSQPQQQFSVGSVTPVKGGRSRSPKQSQQQKQKPKQNGAGGSITANLSSSVGGPGPRTRGGGMRHAMSFDQAYTSPVRSFTAPQVGDYHSQTYQQPTSAFEMLAAKVSGQLPPQQQPQPPLPLSDKTARRLFSPDTTGSAAQDVTVSTGGVPTSLHTILSQVSTADSTTTPNQFVSSAGGTGGGSNGVLPLKVISLEQVEKQMVEDVPSPPVSVNPLSLFTSTTLQQSSAHSLSSSTPKSSISSMQGTPSPQQLLLQPSAFMTSTNAATVTHAPHLASSQSSHSALNQQGVPHSYATGGVNQSVAISVEPPSPVVNLGPIFASEVSPLPGKSAPVIQDHSFPAIPPLMHSPGMRAVPVSQAPPQLQGLKGEPSSLATTTASARSQPSSTTQTKLPNITSQTSGNMSQQVSTSKEERPQLPSTPTKVSSQSTPSLTPLAELSIPRRSTTAPAGPRGGAGALMSPHQFAHSTTATTTPPVGNSDVTAVVPEKSKVKRKGAEPVGLTRQQLQRALLYLIKHDEGFVTKLHEAYQMSLSDEQI